MNDDDVQRRFQEQRARMASDPVVGVIKCALVCGEFYLVFVWLSSALALLRAPLALSWALFAAWAYLRLGPVSLGSLVPSSAAAFALLSVAQFALLLAYQYATSRWFYSASHLSAASVAHFVLAAPAAEELVFRGAMQRIMGARRASAHLPSGALFALVHLLNVFSRMSLSYVLLQSCSAFLAGVSYSILAQRGRGILTPLLLHVLNNACSILMPSASQVPLHDPVVLLNVAVLFGFHVTFIYKNKSFL